MQLRKDLEAKTAASWPDVTASMFPSATSGAPAVPADSDRADECLPRGVKRSADEEWEEWNPAAKKWNPQQSRGYTRGSKGGRRGAQMKNHEWHKGFNQIKGRGKGAIADYFYLYGEPPGKGAPAIHDHWSWTAGWNSWTSCTPW